MADKSIFQQFIIQAKNGSEIARENIISYYKPYIINTVGHLSKRYITWSDEEASIGLIAFNRAIDSYDDQGGRSFLNYAYLLIKRDLIDYYRREKPRQHISMNYSTEKNDITNNQMEVKNSFESFHQTQETQDLVEEILELDRNLNLFGISFEELEYYSPKHKDTRKTLFLMANRFIESQEFIETLLTKKRLPLKSFAKKTGYRIKTIERHRKYLITLIIVKLNPKWIHLSQYIKDS
ncbi:RNA polymerase sigma-I factor [Serpentinicella sp. ANB-PHB4]|uniref:RNA polymerase sigma-I factor n=1 Tax=Serpentinicella sp. ANB-PHB4 TaxID=3074076 RepID=UPI002858B0A8|nr:RNA polymerase sigma-I factor [Serpentinicella sp. ANB-PHB4]MDR5658852.1 RNA polymerase sigma-I factor [Serpentinicella sp. ANB-PHB4]